MVRPAAGRGRGGRLSGRPAEDGVLHRHLGVHRLQGLRGGLQGVERGPGGRPGTDRHVLRQHAGPGRRHLAARGLHRAAQAVRRAGARGRPRGRRCVRGGGPARHRRRFTRPRRHRSPARAGPRGRARRADLPPLPRRPHRAALADGLRRVQALHARGLSGRVSHRVAVPHRVRHGRRPGGHLQRLRVLRAGLSVRRHRPAQGRRPGVEVHPVLRPAGRGHGTRLRQGLSDGLHPVRAAGRTAGAGTGPGGAAARGRGHRRPPVRGESGRRGRRRRRVLPAAGRARGVRPAPGPRGHHPGSAGHVAARGAGGGDAGGARGGRFRGRFCTEVTVRSVGVARSVR
ncbi:Formate dehydrogenase O beta subunit [Streptomyces misionensis JCM 4497]